VEQEALIVGSFVAYLDHERLATIGARRFDPAVYVQGGADPKGIPGAVRVPPPIGGVHA
jgi:hypothetical protein